MSKRTLTALGAVLGSLLLVLGTQQTVVATSAAWTDQVNFSAPVSSGTWVVPASLEFVSPSGMNTARANAFTARQEVSLTVKNTGPVTGMTLSVAVPEWGSDRPALPSVTGPWTVTGSSRGNNVRTFTLVYNGSTPIASNQSTGLSFTHAMQCGANNNRVHQMTATVTSTAPGFVATATTTSAPQTTAWTNACVSF